MHYSSLRDLPKHLNTEKDYYFLGRKVKDTARPVATASVGRGKIELYTLHQTEARPGLTEQALTRLKQSRVCRACDTVHTNTHGKVLLPGRSGVCPPCQ